MVHESKGNHAPGAIFPQMVCFWSGAYDACPQSQTYQVCIANYSICFSDEVPVPSVPGILQVYRVQLVE